MSYRVVFTPSARLDLLRLYEFLDRRDPEAGRKARQALRRAFGYLADFPFNSRKSAADDALLREIVIPFGRAGYVALFEIHDTESIVVLAVRHLREADYFA